MLATCWIGSTGGGVHVRISGHDTWVDQTFQSPITRMEIYSQGGGDHVEIAPDLTMPALVFGGDGRNHVHAGGGPAVVVGGPERDLLEGGESLAILIGGEGADDLEGQSGRDILVSSRTILDANLTALRAILAEWSRTDIDYATRVAHVTGAAPGGLNGPYVLNTTTASMTIAPMTSRHRRSDSFERRHEFSGGRPGWQRPRSGTDRGAGSSRMPTAGS